VADHEHVMCGTLRMLNHIVRIKLHVAILLDCQDRQFTNDDWQQCDIADCVPVSLLNSTVKILQALTGFRVASSQLSLVS